MNKEEVLQHIKLEDVVARYNGGQIIKSGRGFRGLCPFCQGLSRTGKAQEKTSLSIYETQEHILMYKCMRASCNETGNAITMISNLEGLQGEDWSVILEKAKDFIIEDKVRKKTLEDEVEIQKKLQQGKDAANRTYQTTIENSGHPDIIAMLKRRKIYDNVIEDVKDEIGYDPEDEAAVFPIRDISGDVVALHKIKCKDDGEYDVGRDKTNLGPIGKGFFWAGVPNHQLFPNIILVEGVIDALSVASACPQYCVIASIGTGYRKVKELFTGNKTFLLRKLIVCFDNDANGAGRIAMRNTALDNNRIRVVDYSLFEDEDIIYKDINDMLRDGKDEMIADVLRRPKTLFGITVTLENDGVIYLDSSEKWKMHPFSLVKMIVRDLHLKVLDGNSYYIYNGKCYENVSEEKLFSIISDILQLDTYKQLLKSGMRNEIKNFLSDTAYEDRDVIMEQENLNYLTLQNYLFNLETGLPVNHTPNIFTTNLLPYNYREGYVSKEWTRYLGSLFPGEEEMKDYLQELLGYALYKGLPTPFISFIIGKPGTGKSTFLEILSYLFGNENVSAIPLDKLGDQHAVAGFYNKLINVCGETDSDKPLASQILKQISSGDKIYGRELYGKPFYFYPFTKIYVAMNDWPKIVDRTFALYERIYPIEFGQRFRGQKGEVKEYSRVMREEASGIFNWALEGLNRLRINGWNIKIPDSVENLKEYGKRETDPLYNFMRVCFEDGSGSDIRLQHIYEVYQSYMRVNYIEMNVIDRNSLKRNLKKMDFEVKKMRMGGIHLIGYRWTDESRDYR